LASECLAAAQQAPDAQLRTFLVEMAQRWLDLAELAELAELADRAAWNQHRTVQAAIGEQLKALYKLSHALPPHFLALLAQLNAKIGEQNGEKC
jgi:hypothetical protein